VLPNRRWRRQASSTSAQTSGQTNPASGTSSSSGGDGQSGSNQLDANNNDQNSENPPEVLSSLKCDFGTADAPDLCKFKILDHELTMNSLGRSAGLASWTLGNGRLALFQGGPLMDSTGLQAGSNDTNGGYIYYETSSPFVAPQTNTSSPSVPDHAGFVSAPYASTAHHHRPSTTYDQIVTSQRVSVSAPPSANAQQPLGNALPHFAGPSFMTPNLTAPGPNGMCLSFQYAIQGLSADELRIFLNDQKTGRVRTIWSASESAAGNWTKGEVLYSVTNQHSLVFSAMSSSNAIVKDAQQRKFRGHLALDDIDIQRHDPLGEQSACKGHCNFDGDLCGWTNAENNQEDDFDWTFGRGSQNLFTGPARDFTSSSNNELTGSFLFTDSGYPRRPGDRALLVSPMFQPTPVNDAMCMKFAVHMFGSGVGTLAIKLRYADEVAAFEPQGAAANQPGGPQGQQNANQASNVQSGSTSSRAELRVGEKNDLVVWEMSGDGGNTWHQAQTSVSSSRSPFQVLIEGVIGENHLGNIAIDEISFQQGPCPTSPPVASKNYGDCTFEQSMCYWRNPDADIHLDDLDWIRQSDETSIHGPNFDHTLKKRSGSYLKLENTFREPKSGTRAFLLSPVFSPKPSGTVQCLSFYYYMFIRSIGFSGPNLGTIRVYLASNNELVPIWRLTNPISSPVWKHGRASLSTALLDGQPQAPTKLFQIAFEGIWGDATSGAIALDDITVFDGACDLMPPEARSVPGECSFDADMCSWNNKTTTYELNPNGQLVASSVMIDSIDGNQSPFIQSVSGTNQAGSNLGVSGLSGGARSMLGSSSVGRSSRVPMGWQLATVESRPVNLQDHTYKAPIGYAYIDVLETQSQSLSSNGGRTASSLAYPLQSSEITVQSGQQFVQCLSFWFAAYGRQELNQLSVYMTQASAYQASVEESSPTVSVDNTRTSGRSGSGSGQSGSGGPSEGANAAAEAEQSNEWKMIVGKPLWSISLRNITESQRRKWLYGQVTIRADSNHIVRFLATSTDGGFALDDISYFEGSCGTRPNQAKVKSAEDEAAEFASAGGPGGVNGSSGGSGSNQNSAGGATGGAGSSGTGNNAGSSGGGSAAASSVQASNG